MKAIAAAILVAVGIVTPAAAQTDAVRAFVSVNGGVQMGSVGFDDSATVSANAEDGRFTADYVVDSGPSLNVFAGVPVSRRLTAGVGITRFSASTPTTVTGSVPHLFFFNRGREIEGDVGGLTREELALHLRAVVTIPAGRRIDVMLFGGPSLFQVKQGIVTDVDYTDEYPYDTATFSRATVTRAKESKIGFNAGVDVAFFFTRRLGIGGVVQFARANVPLPSAGGSVQEVAVGGLQAGGGLRVRF